MNYNEYMTMTCTYQSKIEFDEDTQMSGYSDPVILKCFTYGKNLFVREAENNTVVSARVYIVNKLVRTGDLIDNQVVKSVNIIPDFDGSLQLLECLTWDS